MINAVIAGYSRSPFTIANKGELINVRPEDMLSEVIKNLVIKSKIIPEDIEDIIAGCAFPEGDQGYNIGKVVSFMTGLYVYTAGMTVNRWCGSSMQSIHTAAGAISMGAGKAFIACGVESMTRVPMNGFNPMPHPKSKANLHFSVLFKMLEYFFIYDFIIPVLSSSQLATNSF